MKHTKTDYLKARVRGKVVRLRFVRRKVRVARGCSSCKGMMPVGSLFWGRGHRVLHIECFEQLQSGIEQSHLRGAGGRKAVLDSNRASAIRMHAEKFREHGSEPNVRTIARVVGVSERTVRRLLTGQYVIAV